MSIINKWWILLDTCSTYCVTNNKDLLSNLTDCQPHETLQVVTNGGGMKFEKQGRLKILPLDLHYNPKSLATILSFKRISSMKGVHVQYDNFVADRFHITLPNKFVLSFSPCENGLYYLDSINLNISQVIQKQNVSLLTTVSDNKQYFTKKEIQDANIAQQMQEDLCWPGTNTLKHYIKHNLIANTTTAIDDINRATLIYGPLKPLYDGKMTRLHPTSHKIEWVPLPLPIAIHHKQVQLYMDFMYQ